MVRKINFLNYFIINYLFNFFNILIIKYIIFEDNCFSRKLINGLTTFVYKARLTYDAKCCINCGIINRDNTIIKNGFKIVNIKTLPVSGKPAVIRLRKTRFLCKACNSTFIANTNFASKFHSISHVLFNKILTDLTMNKSMKDIAIDNFVSPSTVNRILGTIDVISKPKLPEAICVDEFSSVKSVDFKMSFIFCNAENSIILDILPDRKKPSLEKYFQKYNLEDRANVKYLVCDMYAPYVEVFSQIFYNAKIVFDRFHIIQNFSRALNKTRVKIMNTYPKSSIEYKILKKYWKLLLKNSYELNSSKFKKYTHFRSWQSQATIVDSMLEVDEILMDCYKLYQGILAAMNCNDSKIFFNVVELYKNNPNISEHLKTAIETAVKFKEYICNSLETTLNNGRLEGMINKIKTLKKTAYGFRSFLNLKRRINLYFKNFKDISIKQKNPTRFIAT